MTPERWQRIKDVFSAVQEHDGDRLSLLQQMTQGDDDLRTEIEWMLRNQSNCGDDFLETPGVQGLLPVIPPSESRIFEAGARIGRWQVLRLLGTGGMGEVYKAFDTELQEHVALKTIRSSIAGNHEALGRFRAEIRAARKIAHPNICKVYDLFTDATGAGQVVRFVTMELIEGETLAARIQRGPLPATQGLDLVRQMVDGLAAAHAHGIVHSDFKSANIMLAPASAGAGRVVITDFGLARNLFPQPGALDHVAAAGTPGYMAPEQWTSSDVTFATDIYALGVVLYEMATGAPPFGDRLSASLLRRQKTWTPASVLALRPDLDPRWDTVITRCLQPDPARRFQDVREVLDGLEGAESSPPRAPGISRRAVTAIATAVAFVVMLALFLLPKQLHESGPVKSVLVLPVTAEDLLLRVGDLHPKAEDSGRESYVNGVVDRVIDTLARTPGIRAVPRDSVDRLLWPPKPADSPRLWAGIMSGVDIVAEIAEVRPGVAGAGGRQSLQDGQTFVTVKLLDRSSNFVMWSEDFWPAAGGQFAMQDRIASAVVHALHPAAGPVRRSPVHVPKPDAYSAYLDGMYDWHQRGRVGLSYRANAVEAFERAVQSDPEYLDPYVGLVDAYTAFAGSTGFPLDIARKRARDAAALAMKLDPGSAEAWRVRALVLEHFDLDWAAAENGFLRALRLDPLNAEAHRRYAGLLSNLGHVDQAMQEYDRSLDLGSNRQTAESSKAICLVYGRRYAQARNLITQVIRREPETYLLYLYLGAIHLHEGNCKEGLSQYERGVTKAGRNSLSLFHYAYALGTCGDAAKSREILREALQHPDGAEHPFYEAMVLGALRRNDEAFRALDRAFAAKNPELVMLKVHPYSDSLREDPRFQKYLQLMHYD